MPTAPTIPSPAEHAGPTLHVFTPRIKAVWLAIVAATIISELVPVSPHIHPEIFYPYKAAKIVAFVAVGFIAPLAFWRFNALNRGILLAAASATLVETLQGILGFGHSFHWYELLGKLILILVGFALALETRYDREIAIGPIRINLSGEKLRA